MRKYRFYIKSEINVGSTVSLPDEVIHQITRVLRLREGARIFLIDNSGYEYSADFKTNSATIIERSRSLEVSKINIHLGQVIGKGTKMDFVIQKATELGVTSITPLFSERSISNKTNKVDHWQRIAVASSCQCLRNTIPHISSPQPLTEWISQQQNNLKLMFVPGGSKLNSINITNDVVILIGPEGGFSNEEIIQARQNGFSEVSLGPRVLRTETAGVAAIAILQYMSGAV